MAAKKRKFTEGNEGNKDPDGLLNLPFLCELLFKIPIRMTLMNADFKAQSPETPYVVSYCSVAAEATKRNSLCDPPTGLTRTGLYGKLPI